MYKENIAFDKSLLSDGMTAIYTMSRDEDFGAPWEECETLGAVEWVRDVREKKPGQKVLSSNGRRSEGFLYDYAESVKTARKEGMAGWKAVEVADSEFKRFSEYLANDWHYAYIEVCIKDRDGNILHEDDLSSVESDDDSFIKEWFLDAVDAAKKELDEKQRCNDMGIITK